MTPPWTPHASGARPLRLVVAIDEKDLPEDDLHRVAFPRLELHYGNGTTRVVRFP
jgi:hypothetical protein